ncbi:MAG: DUF547 domain-containing protein [Planctomycetota bacterium]
MSVVRPFSIPVTAFTALVFVFGGVASAEPPANRQSKASVPLGEVDHSDFSRLLGKYVDTDGYVDYTAWRANSSDRASLKRYLDELGRADRAATATKSERLAFWINAYNAVTVEGILRVYPTKSIRDHTAKLWGYNIWDDLALNVGGEAHSLNDIEHKILRKMGEPRIHFAIVCASVGCPRLLDEAYVGETLDAQLSTNARDFFARSKSLRVDGPTLYLSSLLSWFGGDFGDGQDDRLAAVRPYLPADARKLVDGGKVRVRYLDYDWSLNDVKSKPAGDRPRS